MNDGQNGLNRLDSWKAIAAYLNRDVRTVRRWEQQGLPVHRVPGGQGRSVFAYTSEIDAWLKASVSEQPAVSERAAPSGEQGGETPSTAHQTSLMMTRRTALTAGVSLLVLLSAAAIWRVRTAAIGGETVRLEVTPEAVVAFDAAGAQRWRHAFSPAYLTALSEVGASWRIAAGAHPGIFAATAQRVRRADDLVESGALLEFDNDGAVRRSFSFGDDLRFHNRSFGAPWCITAFAIDERTGRIAVAAHHFVWSASLVAILDDQFHRRGTYVQSGWIEAVHWIAPDRLLIGGFNHPRDGGMVALLDPAALDAQAPEPPGTEDYCESCGAGRPVRMVVMPRTEINLATGSSANRARIQILPDRIVARTIEVPETASGSAVDVLYELTPELDLLRASFSKRYWETDAALRAAGKLSHDAADLPDSEGPRNILVWEPTTGWRNAVAAPSETSPR